MQELVQWEFEERFYACTTECHEHLTNDRSFLIQTDDRVEVFEIEWYVINAHAAFSIDVFPASSNLLKGEIDISGMFQLFIDVDQRKVLFWDPNVNWEIDGLDTLGHAWS